jgi:hypothetical protein
MLEATQRRCPQCDAIQVVVEVVEHLDQVGGNDFFGLLSHHVRHSIPSWDVLRPLQQELFPLAGSQYLWPNPFSTLFGTNF